MLVKGTSFAHLLVCKPSLPLHLPCLTRLVVNVNWLQRASGERGPRECTQMGNFNELENKN